MKDIPSLDGIVRIEEIKNRLSFIKKLELGVDDSFITNTLENIMQQSFLLEQSIMYYEGYISALEAAHCCIELAMKGSTNDYIRVGMIIVGLNDIYKVIAKKIIELRGGK